MFIIRVNGGQLVPRGDVHSFVTKVFILYAEIARESALFFLLVLCRRLVSSSRYEIVGFSRRESSDEHVSSRGSHFLVRKMVPKFCPKI